VAAEQDRRTAFEALFTAHYRAVRAYAIRRNAASVEDVLGDVFLVAWRRVESVPDDSLPWLLGVARRVMANQGRAERRRDALSRRLRSVHPSEPRTQSNDAVSDEVAAALASLSEREREALLLVAWEGLEPHRAAKAAGCSPAAFRVRLHRARRRVAAQLSDAAPDAQQRITEELR
jgi:RNA polymerase sigma factor (sigma-70 family)